MAEVADAECREPTEVGIRPSMVKLEDAAVVCKMKRINIVICSYKNKEVEK